MVRLRVIYGFVCFLVGLGSVFLGRSVLLLLEMSCRIFILDLGFLLWVTAEMVKEALPASLVTKVVAEANGLFVVLVLVCSIVSWRDWNLDPCLSTSFPFLAELPFLIFYEASLVWKDCLLLEWVTCIHGPKSGGGLLGLGTSMAGSRDVETLFVAFGEGLGLSRLHPSRV